MYKIRREKRTTISEVIVRGNREILNKINKIGIGFISIFFLLNARVSYSTILKRKTVSLPFKDETDQFVICLVLPVSFCQNDILPSDSEANCDDADPELPFPLFFSFSASFKNSGPREKVEKLSSFCY